MMVKKIMTERYREQSVVGYIIAYTIISHVTKIHVIIISCSIRPCLHYAHIIIHLLLHYYTASKWETHLVISA